MERLTVDASTLPGLNDLFPENFFERLEQAVHVSSQQMAMLPQQPDAASSPAHTQQQDFDTQQQQMWYAMGNGIPANAYSQHISQTQARDNSDRRVSISSHDAAQAHGSSHPQSQDPYFYPMTPTGPLQPISAPPDVHLHLPGAVETRESTVEAEGDDDADGTADGEKRRHSCPRCGKRFNRPSSLKIHQNTHTGAKPYVCPFYGCGRTFNVSSNMRRHFRNHARRPPPPPLPQNNIYPFSASRPEDQQDQRDRVRPSQVDLNTRQQSLSLPASYDNCVTPRLPLSYSGHFYPPSSDVRNTSPDLDQRVTDGALITPPYTNEGDEHDRSGAVRKNFFPSMGDYDAYGPGHGNSTQRLMHSAQHMDNPGNMVHVQGSVGMPPGMSLGAPPMFPVDPSLVVRHDENDPDADGEADADGEVDPELEVNNARRESDVLIEAATMRRFGPSTSDTRSSSGSRVDLSPRRNRQHPETRNSVVMPFPGFSFRHDGLSAEPSTNISGMHHRHMPPPVSVYTDHDSSHVTPYVDQYPMQYPQQSRPFQQQGVTGQPGDNPQYYQTQPYHPYSNSMQHNAYRDQRPHFTGLDLLNSHNVTDTASNGIRNGNTIRRADAGGAPVHPQSGIRAAGDGSRVGGDETEGGSAVKDNIKQLSRTTPGTAPAPPYELYSHVPSEPLGVARTATCDVSSRPGSRNVGNEEDEREEESDEESDEDADYDDDNDDNDEYTGRPATKKSKASKRNAAARGRPRGRPKSSGNTTGRGRGRPRKSAPATIQKNEPAYDKDGTRAQNDADSPGGIEIGGRVLRKRRRASAR